MINVKEMKIISKLTVLLLALALFLSACAPAAPAASPTPAAITVPDGMGGELSLAQPAQRVISLAPSNTEILFAVGAGKQVVGREDFSNYPAEALDLPSVGGSMAEYNYEQMVNLKPDLVLASPLTPPEAIQSMQDLKLVVLVLPNPTKLAGMYANLELVGKVTGHEQETAQLVAGLKEREEKILAVVAKATELPKVFYELDATEPAKPWTSGPGTFVDLLITLAGGQNVGAALQGEWAQISQEELIVQNPDVILLGDALYGGITAEMVAQRPGWDVIQAVKDGRVHAVNDDQISRPGPRQLDGLTELVKLLHPDLASELP